MTNMQLAMQFLLQVAIILCTCRLVGVVAALFGQPQVVAEMIAGVCLGPSLLGMLFPEFHAWLFPWNAATRDTQSYLFPVSQLGLALYMFVVGMEFRVDVVRAHWKSAMAVSAAGMIAPFGLGYLLGLWFHRETTLFPPGTPAQHAAVFLAASMCITAFPMLARIIHFKGLTGTRMGTIALGAGAVDDASAWCLLAFVLAGLDGDLSASLQNIGGGLAFVAVALLVIRPVLRMLVPGLTADGSLSDAGMALCLIAVALASFTTDLIGLHAVFGAFVIGAVIPRGVVTRDAIQRIQPLTVSLLLPLFFTFSGLNTRIGLLTSGKLLVDCGLVLLVAFAGKGLACWLAARATGVPNREALGIGVLMNARGLMELIIINIGRDRGLISDELFAMLVIMAVVTTLIASPAFDLLMESRPQT
jgi:Kef-type K+ transport system membrane component KefB